MYHYDFSTAFDGKIEEMEKKLASSPIDEDVRGWNYTNSRLAPQMDINVSVSGVAHQGEYDKEEEGTFNMERVEGKLLHEVYSILLEETLNFIHDNDTDIKDITKLGKHLVTIAPTVLEINRVVAKIPLFHEVFKKANLKPDELGKIKKHMNELWNYEALLLYARFMHRLSDSPKDDTLSFMSKKKQNIVADSMPFTVAETIDGAKLGLSRKSEMDIFINSPKKAIIEIKTGSKHDLKRDMIQVTGYALARESNHKDEPIDIGAVLYIRFSDDVTTPSINCNIFPIQNQLRMEFILLRDKLMEQKVGTLEGARR